MKSKTLKLSILTVIMAFISSGIYAQPQVKWAAQFGTDQEEYVMNHSTDQEGNIYVCGKTKGSMQGKNQGSFDGFVMKLDAGGNALWTRQFGTDGEENEQWCAADIDGNIYITGSTTGNLQNKNSGLEDVFVVKYDKDGDLAWMVQCGTDSSEMGTGIAVDGGFVYVTGSTTGKIGETASGKSDGFIMKLDAGGKILYTHQFGSPLDDIITGITIDHQRIIACGNTWGNPGGNNSGFLDGFTAQFDPDGNLIKYSQFGSEGFDITMNVITDNQGNIYAAGSTSGNFAAQQSGAGDCFVVKLDKEGRIIWKKQFGTDRHDGSRSIALTKEGDVLVSGLMKLPPAMAFIRCYTSEGKLIWEKLFGSDAEHMDASGKDVGMDNKGNIIHIGLTQSSLFGPQAGVSDFYIIRL